MKIQPKKAMAFILTLSLMISLWAGCGPADAPERRSADAKQQKETDIPGDDKPKQETGAARTLASAVYPEMAPFPNETDYYTRNGDFNDDAYFKVYDIWWKEHRERLDMAATYTHPHDFYSSTIRDFLSDAGDGNRIYSPLNVYIALAMLAEITDGESRSQILALLGDNSLENVRKTASAMWLANYCDDGDVTVIPASSLWLNQDLTFRQDTVDALAKHYYASTYQGQMGSAQFNQVLRDWLDEQTGGLLQEQAQGAEFSVETILALASTLYFKAGWTDEFPEGNTTQGIFHSPGADNTCDFMKMSSGRNYYWGENFAAVSLGFRNSGKMWLILPDEESSVEELLREDSGWTALFLPDRTDGEESAWENQTYLTVNLSVPKFDVSSDINLTENLQNLGITDVFISEKADFTSIMGNLSLGSVSEVKHAARVKIDEEGCEAAAFTLMRTDGCSMPPTEEVDFILDRPFLFVITGSSGDPLFAGVVNQPF